MSATYIDPKQEAQLRRERAKAVVRWHKVIASVKPKKQWAVMEIWDYAESFRVICVYDTKEEAMNLQKQLKKANPVAGVQVVEVGGR